MRRLTQTGRGYDLYMQGFTHGSGEGTLPIVSRGRWYLRGYAAGGKARAAATKRYWEGIVPPDPLKFDKRGKGFCEVCNTGVDHPEKEGMLFCHTQDCAWLIDNVAPDENGWRATPRSKKNRKAR